MGWRLRKSLSSYFYEDAYLVWPEGRLVIGDHYGNPSCAPSIPAMGGAQRAARAWLSSALPIAMGKPFVWLVVAVVLTVAPVRLQAQNTAGTNALANGATIPGVAIRRISDTQPASPLSEAQLKQISDFLAANGHDADIGADIAGMLGLPRTFFKQLVLKDPESGFLHSYIRLPGNGYLISFLNITTAYTYRLDSNFKVVASVAFTHNIPSEIKDPETGAKAELAYWAAVADELSP